MSAGYWFGKVVEWKLLVKKNSYPESGKKVSCSHVKAALFKFKGWNERSSSRYSNYPRLMQLVLSIKRGYVLKNIKLHIKIIEEPATFNIISRWMAVVCHTWLLQNNTPPLPREQSALPGPAESWELPCCWCGCCPCKLAPGIP